MTTTFQFSAIGSVCSPYHEKFAIPRQPNLVAAARGYIILSADFNNLDCVRELDGFSHIWLQFVFHQTQEKGWKPTVRPPRLGGNKRIGVFATRSTFRPNPIGLSVVEYLGAEMHQGRVRLKIAGFDLMDQTPILDIKPYLNYADSLPQANSSYAQDPPETVAVQFTAEAKSALSVLFKQQANRYFNDRQSLSNFILAVLAQDPRPAYKKIQSEDDKLYRIQLAGFEVSWRYNTSLSLILIECICLLKFEQS